MASPFETALQVHSIPEPFRSAAIETNDTLELAWKSAQSVFGDKASPTDAIAICALMLKMAGRMK